MSARVIDVEGRPVEVMLAEVDAKTVHVAARRVDGKRAHETVAKSAALAAAEDHWPDHYVWMHDQPVSKTRAAHGTTVYVFKVSRGARRDPDWEAEQAYVGWLTAMRKRAGVSAI
jgi:hypothetical protein